MSNDLQRLQHLIRKPESVQGAVLKSVNGVATVSTSQGTFNVAADLAVHAGDVVTIRDGRIVSKRTGGAGGAIKTFHV